MLKRRFISVSLLLLLLITLIAPGLAQDDDITLEAFTSDTFAIQGERPAGWTEAAPGVYARGASMTDTTVLLLQAAPLPQSDLVATLLPSLQIEALPESSDTIETDALTWDLYNVEVEAAPGLTIAVEIALAEQNGTTYLVILQTSPDEFDALRDDVFMPVLMAYAPLSDDAGDESADTDDSASGDQEFVDPQGLFTTVVPAGWTITYNDEDAYGYVSSPQGEITYYLLALEVEDASEMEDAIERAWRIVQPDFDLDYTEDEVIEIEDAAMLSGTEAGLAIIYEDGSGDDQRIVQGGAEYLDGIVYIGLLDADLVTLQQRISQLQIISTGIDIAAVEDVDLTEATPNPIDDALIADLEAFIEDAMMRLSTPGVTIAIVQGDEVVYKNGFGTKTMDGDDPVNADTHMMMGSTTKPMTTTVMAMLVDDGVLDWDAPAQDYLPEFGVQDPELSETITVANLVCACTGVPRRDFELLFNFNDLTPESIVESVQDFEFFTDFGEAFQYSNQLVATGGFVATAATGVEYGNLGPGYFDLMQTRFMDPLNMSNTTFDFEPVIERDDYALPHGAKMFGEYERIPLSYEEFGLPIAPAAALWSTVEDMAQFMILHLNNGVTADGERLVSEENLMRTREPQIAIDAETDYGLGWIMGEYKGLQVVTHGGNMLGFTSDFAFLPEADLGIVVLTNKQGDSLNARVRLRFFELLYDIDSELSLPDDDDLAESASNREESLANSDLTFESDDDIAERTGDYSNADLGDVSLTLNDAGELILDAGEFQSQIIRRIDEDTDEVTYALYQSPLAGLNVVLNDDGTFTTGTGVVAYTFEPVE